MEGEWATKAETAEGRAPLFHERRQSSAVLEIPAMNFMIVVLTGDYLDTLGFFPSIISRCFSGGSGDYCATRKINKISITSIESRQVFSFHHHGV